MGVKVAEVVMAWMRLPAKGLGMVEMEAGVETVGMAEMVET
jgi:hypothetical protein